MLVEHLPMKEAQQTVLPRGSRKRRARVGDSPGAAERAKTPRRHQVVPPAQRITKPEPDEDSGLGFDDPHDQPASGASETTHLLRAGLVASVRKAARGKEDGTTRDSCFIRDVRSASDVQPPTTFLKGDNPVSKCGKYRLELTKEPETRHRARYQTEGSRGAVKDASGKTSPQVTLKGCSEPVALQMYVGSDADGCTPHLFYQSCRVTGKTASPSDELLLSGTAVIQTTMTPDKSGHSVSARCDCLGILKQRNVDIESRVAAAQGGGGGGAASASGGGRRSAVLRKGARTTSCRLVFRVTVLNGHGHAETLQIASRSIICTQPQGVPEITKLSISEASPVGGQELIVLGKNFVKDSRVVFTETADGGATVWSRTVVPHKDHLQAVHLVCNVPTYRDARLVSPLSVSLTVRSGDRESEGVPFAYTPTTSADSSAAAAAAGDDPDRSSEHDSAEPGRGKQLPNGVSQAAIAINRHFAETGEILLGSNQQRRQPSAEQPKKTVAAVQTELASPTGTSVVVQPPATATADSGAADSRSEKVPTLLVPVVTDANQSPNMFVTVELSSSAAAAAGEAAAAAPLLAAPAVWTGQQEQQKPVTQRQEVTVPAAWASPPPPPAAVTEGCGAAKVWSPPQQPAVSPQGVWPAAVSQVSAGTPQSTSAWSPPLAETAIVQDAWSPAAAAGSVETANWASPQPRTPAAETAWSPPKAETAWSSPKAEAAAAQSVWPSAGAASVAGQEGAWTRPAEAPAETAESIWKQEVESIVSESVQSWATAAEAVEAVSQHDWPQPVAGAAAPAAWSGLGETKAALEHEWPATAAETEARRSWSSESESKASPATSDWSGGAAAAETKVPVSDQPWPTLVEVKASWSQKADDAQTAPAQAWTGPTAEKTWSAPQQQQQQQQQANLHNQQQGVQQQQQASLHSQQLQQPAELHSQQQGVQQQQQQQASLHSQQLQQPAELHSQQQGVQQQQQASLHSQQLQQPAELHSQQHVAQPQQQQANLHSQQQLQPADLHSQQQSVQQQQQQQQQPQQQWTAEAAAAAAAEVRSWSREQLADAFRETMTGSPASVPEPAGGGATVAAAAPAAPASRSDPMWGEVSYGAPVSAAAEDSLTDLPKGMGLIMDFINGDGV